MGAIPQALAVIIMLVAVAAIAPVSQQAQALAHAQAYQGIADPRTVNANGAFRWLDLKNGPPYTPWLGAYFINDGPDPVEIALNYPDDRFTLKPGETVTVNRSGAREGIAVIFYVCGSGKTATVRVTGEY